MHFSKFPAIGGFFLSMNKRKRGYRFENIAKDYLLNKGFNFIESNFTIQGGEIDLIMQKDDYIVFIEVKSLRDNSDFSVYELITKRKKRSLTKTIDAWLLKNNLINIIWRVDYIAITKKDSDYQIEHFEFMDINS